MFEDDKIEFIRSLPEGDAIIVTWIQMLTIAGKCNRDGYLMVTKDIPYTEELLCTKLRRQPVFLKFALETLQRLEMVNVEDGPFHITKWEKHQNVEGMKNIQSKAAIRQKEYRERQKTKSISITRDVTRDVTNDNEVTSRNAIEVERELDKEKDTTLLNAEFEKVRIAYREMHQVIDLPYKDSMRLEKLLRDGFNADLIIGIMTDKFKKGVKTLGYYEGAIRDTADVMVSRKPRSRTYYEHPSEKEAQHAARMAKQQTDEFGQYAPTFEVDQWN
jgi:predicted phage replisome organizer